MVHHIRLSKCVSRWVEGGFYKTYLRPPQQPTAIFFAKYWYYYSDYTICPIRAIEIFNQLLSLFKLLYCSYSTTTEIYLKTSSGHCHGHHWLNGCGWCILNKFLNNVWKLPHSAFFLWVVQQSEVISGGVATNRPHTQVINRLVLHRKWNTVEWI